MLEEREDREAEAKNSTIIIGQHKYTPDVDLDLKFSTYWFE